jgi:5-methylthioadenosine/S-adenosylhomocysteine deaminase
MDSIAQQPLYNPASQLVYTNTGDKVTHSWVAGKPLLIQGQLQTMNRQSLIQTATDWRNKIAS